MSNWRIKFCCILALVFGAATLASEDVADHDNSRLSIFVQPAISFLSFEEREYFQDAIDTIYNDFYSAALDEEESLSVAKQDFQKVNFCFPVTGGLQFQFLEDQFISAGIGFIYDNEAVVLTDRKNKTHDYSYTIQGIPLFLEYRLAIPQNFLTLSDGSLFSIAVRWYWALPGTEIYTSWGKLEAEKSIFGSGFGISLGYMFASWKNFNIFGDIGFSTISVESKKTFADIVPNGPDEKAKWDIGGLQLQIRVSFGVWSMPVIDTTDATQDKGKSAKTAKASDSTKVANDSSKVISDSTKISAGDSTKVLSDSTKAANDSANVASDSTKISTGDSTIQKDSSNVTSQKSEASKSGQKSDGDATSKGVQTKDTPLENKSAKEDDKSEKNKTKKSERKSATPRDKGV